MKNERKRMKPMCLLALLYTGTITLAQNVQYNYDRDADFAAYKACPWVGVSRMADQMVDKDIRRPLMTSWPEKAC